MLRDDVDRGFQELGPPARDPQYLPRSIYQLVQARVPAKHILLLSEGYSEFMIWGGGVGVYSFYLFLIFLGGRGARRAKICYEFRKLVTCKFFPFFSYFTHFSPLTTNSPPECDWIILICLNKSI